jgi:carbonic anhydrase/acetyltransferase-like protein (isoleucine patch superfamily)
MERIREVQGRKPVVHPSAWIADNAYLMGDIEVHEGASIWPGAVLRAEYGRIIVGRNAAILDRAVVHGGGVGALTRVTDIGEGTVIGVAAMIHGMAAGRNTRIGDNATVLEAAMVGDWCFVEPRAAILPRAVIPSSSVVAGVPGAVTGQIDQRIQQLLTIQGHQLAARADLHRGGTKPGTSMNDSSAEEGRSNLIRSLDGKTPKISPKAWVSEAAYVVGDVEIGEQVTVFPGAVVRGDAGKITIGAKTNVQDNAVIYSDGDLDIGESTTIGHAVTIHGRRVGNHCLIGNNSTVSEGVEIGDFSVIAAGAAVAPHSVVPGDSFVAGVPGEILWRTEPERRRAMEESGGEGYARLSAIYQAEGLGSWPPDGEPPS